MNLSTDRIAWLAVSGVAALLTRRLAARALDGTWQALMHDDPPARDGARSAGFGRALAWTVGSAVILSTADFLVREGAAAGWRSWRGEDPPEG
jgi:hypothetical protein